jgi:AcrR family transcriptional regulator
MARPREHSDDDLLERISAGLADSSGTWSLSEAARAAGVHPATLVKRFGSKHGLLVVLSHRWLDGIPVAPRSDDCLAELRSWIEGIADPPPDRSRGVAGLTMLLEDVKDDVLSDLLHTGWKRQLSYLAALLSGARAQGALMRAPDPEVGAAVLLDLVNGSYLRAAAATGPPTIPARHTLRTIVEGWT